MKKVFAIALALCLILCCFSASAETVLEKIKKDGVLVVGTEATYGPYEFLDDDSNPIGCDIWLAQQIADELGVEPKIQDMSFDGIIPAVQSKLIEKVLTDSELFELDTYPNLAMETVNGNIAGFVCDAAVGLGMVSQNDNLEVANFVFTAEEASFGKACVVAKDNADFLEIVNKVVDRVVEDGSYLKAFEEYDAIWKAGAEETK